MQILMHPAITPYDWLNSNPFLIHVHKKSSFVIAKELFFKAADIHKITEAFSCDYQRTKLPWPNRHNNRCFQTSLDLMWKRLSGR